MQNIQEINYVEKFKGKEKKNKGITSIRMVDMVAIILEVNQFFLTL